MAEAHEKEFEQGVRREAASPYWRQPKWEVTTGDIVGLLTEAIWERWKAMEHAADATERLQQATTLARSARWRVVRHLNRYYRRKEIVRAPERG